jgi:hypothetical protein
MIRFKACPKCRGDLEWEADEKAWACIQCGCRVPLLSRLGLLITPIPPKPITGNKYAIRRHYEHNRTRIIAEAHEFGEDATKKRWGIRNEAWPHLKRQFGLPINKPGGHGRASMLPGRSESQLAGVR